MEYFAHSGAKLDQSDWQPLKEHLRSVAKLARKFAKDARPGDCSFADAAEAAGRLHYFGEEES